LEFFEMKKLSVVLALVVTMCIGGNTGAQHERVLPTWLHRDLTGLPENHADFSTNTCHYQPIFGEGDSEKRLPLSIARFGEVALEPHGECRPVSYPRQEELFFVRDGKGALHDGGETLDLEQNDFTYVAPTLTHSVSNPSDHPLRLIVATIKIPVAVALHAPPKPVVANLSELKEQTVEGHPPSVQYKLLIGPHTGTRDRINAAYRAVDFFLMDFAPAGTNFPHHHEIAEEVYLVLDGEGQIVAGGGMDGIEGRHAAKPGDAYYFRPYCTVGFYNRDVPNAKAHILALRVLVSMPATD
jgi:mannose-6-phosphate isomerase-like protein (cupin superfamily)